MTRKAMYEVINTKVAAMSAKLLQEEDYKKTISLKSSSEIAFYLKNSTSYGELFKAHNPQNMRRGDIERVLSEGAIGVVSRLINYFDGGYRSFFKCFYMKYEIYDLKRIARAIHIDRDFNSLKDNLVFAGKYRYIDMDRVTRSKTVAELILSLDGTVYYPFLKNLVDGNTEESLYRFEMALDRAFFTMLDDNAKKLDDRDRKVFYDLYGSYIDMLNIQWIYRGKKYFNLSPEEIFNYSIAKGNKFNYSKIKKFCYSSSLEELGELIRATPYGFMFKGDRLQDIYMERRMNRFLYFKLKTARKRFRSDISAVLAFLELIEFEMRDIISIIENVRYGMDYEEARNYLIKAI